MSPVRDTTLTLREVSVGDQLPELAVPLTRTLIVATAMASRDYQDVHHDPGLAVERGSEDIFMNILTTNGLVGRFVTDWTGPGALIEKMAIRLGVPNYPGDTMTLRGRVVSVGPAAGRHDSGPGRHDSGPERHDSGPEGGPGGAEGRGRVEIEIRGTNSRGDHVTGTVAISLPLGPHNKDGERKRQSMSRDGQAVTGGTS